MSTAANMVQPNPDGAGGRLVTADGRTLPLVGATVRAVARAGLARVTLEQRFRNPYPDPLHLTYVMPLPADGAVSGYAFTVGARRIVGEVDRRQAARERFEEALASGRSAALVEQERASLFTQELGNVPPGADVVAELVIDQKLAWLDEGAWEWRFPTVAMPRYLGAAGRVADADRVAIDVADAPLPPRVRLELAIGDRLADGRRPESPSHPLTVGGDGTVALAADGGAALDRDLVVRWAVAAPAPGLALDVGRPAAGKPHAAHAYGLATLVPPARAAATHAVARDLSLLVDTSGSMGGEPLAQARRILTALVHTLGDGDSLEMIEFSSRPRRWKKEPVRATAAARAEACRWIARLEAGGGTEMRDAIVEALAPLRAEAQRQIVLVTDGAIGFESEIVAHILAALPRSSRVHTVGVGSAVNRALTQAAARAGRGAEVIVGLGEDPERAATRLRARTDAPLVVDVTLEGAALVRHAPAKLPDLFAGAPALCALELRPEGGELVARGRTADGEWSQRLVVPPVGEGSGNGGVVALFGREAVEDLEARLCAGEAREELDRAIERLGLDFQIATRLTSWIAVSEEPTVDPRAPMRRERVPQELPYGVSVEGLGLRTTGAPPTGMMQALRTRSAPAPMAGAYASAGGMPPRMGPPRPKAAAPAERFMNALGRVFKREAGESARDDVDGEAPTEMTESGDTLAGAATRRGRIVRQKGRELVVELTLSAPLDWDPPSHAQVACDDGATLLAAVDAARTTAPQTLSPGHVVRLVLVLDGEPATPPRTITVGALTIEV